MTAKEITKRPIGRRDAYVSGGGARAARGTMGLHGALGGEASARLFTQRSG